MYFKINIADTVIGITSIYEEIYKMCLDYLTDDNVDFDIKVIPDDIEFERQKSIKEAQIEKLPIYNYPDSYLETLAVYRKIAVKMLERNTFLMHGSAVAVDNEAFIFTAPSGTGKTTHTKLWLDNIPGAFVVNGDKPLIKVNDDMCEVCGTPWAGKEGFNTNTSVPLSAICILERGKKNQISALSFKEAYPFLFSQIYKPAKGEDIVKTLELIKKLAQSVRFYRLACNMDPEAAKVAFKGMKER